MIASIFEFLYQLSLDALRYTSVIAVGVFVFFSVLALAWAVNESRSASHRNYMDAPPAFMAPLWVLITLVAWPVQRLCPDAIKIRIDERLKRFGVSFNLQASELIAAFIVYPTLLVGGAMVVSQTGSKPIATEVYLLLGVLGLLLPEMWLRDQRNRRNKEVSHSLPTYLEYLSMCVDAGLNFSGALRQAVEKGPHGAMRNEFRIVSRDLRAGFSRADALTRMGDRLGSADIQTFVSAVNQAEKMGASIRDTLRIQAEQRLNERFQRAEKMAMEAPVKLVVPLVAFIFPLTFIMLLFPIVVRFIEEGSMF
ncbi:type II secretion system F family protein [Litorivicinus lipolyticus]|uniref:type II secretion system F family protein n=1 Tax=Litorivicinus lipolyticus TaxID=418701 RepID=UPI003B59D5D8